jgi:hypothetical protein
MDLTKTLEQLRRVAQNADVSNSNISQWSVGMHVEHCCITIVKICRALQTSQLPAPKEHISLGKSFVFFTGIIPRGRATAPNNTLPATSKLAPEQLFDLLDQAQDMLQNAAKLSAANWIKHPAFGTLRRDKALKFIRIHNLHHLKIIKAIITA